MVDMILKEEEYGKEYLDELKKILDIRKERRVIYGDSFKDEPVPTLQTIIGCKINRAEQILDIHGITHPKYRDEISDVVNYMIFLLFKISKVENAN